MVSLGEVGSAAQAGGHGRWGRGRCGARWWRAGADGGALAFGGGDLFGADAAAGVRDVPVGEGVTGVGEVATDGLETLVGEVAQTAGDVRVDRVAKAVMEVGGGDEDFLECGEDAVVGGGQYGEYASRIPGGGGFADAPGEMGDGGTQRQIVDRPAVGVEVLVAVDVVSDGPKPGDGFDPDAGVVALDEVGGGAVVGLVDADHRDEARTLQDAVGLGVSAAGEDLLGVRVAADGQESVGQGRRDVSPTVIAVRLP